MKLSKKRKEIFTVYGFQLLRALYLEDHLKNNPEYAQGFHPDDIAQFRKAKTEAVQVFSDMAKLLNLKFQTPPFSDTYELQLISHTPSKCELIFELSLAKDPQLEQTA